MDAQALGLLHRIVDGLVDDLGIHGVLLRDGIGDQHAALEAHVQLRAEGRGDALGGVQAVVHAEAALAGVEGGQLLGLIADHRHALGLQVLQRKSQIQDRLRARAHHQHARLGKLLQVGGDIHGGLRAAMHAADAAGGKHADARHLGDDHGGGNGGRAVVAPGNQHRKVAAGGLDHVVALLAEVGDLLLGEARLQAPADDGDGCRNRAVFADDALDVQRSLHVLRIGHAVGDDGGLQGNHGPARIQRRLDLRRDIQIGIQIHVRYLLRLHRAAIAAILSCKIFSLISGFTVSMDSTAMEAAAMPAMPLS